MYNILINQLKDYSNSINSNNKNNECEIIYL